MVQQNGQRIALFGVVMLGGGGFFYLLGRLGINHLPGDLAFGKGNWRVYLPLGTCIFLSILLTLILYLLSRLQR